MQHLETLVPLPGSRLVLERRQAGSERRHSEAREVTSPCSTVQCNTVKITIAQYNTVKYISTCTRSHTLSRGWRGQESRCTSPTVTPAHPLYLLLPALLPLLTGDAVAEPQHPAPRPQRARGQAEEGRRGGGAGSGVLRHCCNYFYLFLW